MARNTVIGPRPHDLLRVASVAQLCAGGPAWVTPALRQAPWVVVRRARCAPGYLPVGVRGPSRSHRHATVVEIDAITEVLSPADLLDRVDQLPNLPVTEALRRATALLNPTGLRWGPGGSVGFSLAAGVLAAAPTSDLDLVVTVDDVPPLAMLARLRDAFAELHARVDCQLDLPIGGIAINDILGPTDQVLVRTNDGPSLMRVGPLAS
ncbi:MAG TPA: malonate decarboxylase holo-ACP synthase [Mycobacterium sp.]|jgi:phosphoribosyl-dephospho-CoA transferase|nr:malonate decarboxylase holo-ACP synthase [Mycobacterium sp.]